MGLWTDRQTDSAPINSGERPTENPTEPPALGPVRCLTFPWHLKHPELKVIQFGAIRIHGPARLSRALFTNYLLSPLTKRCRGAPPAAGRDGEPVFACQTTIPLCLSWSRL